MQETYTYIYTINTYIHSLHYVFLAYINVAVFHGTEYTRCLLVLKLAHGPATLVDTWLVLT